MRQASVLLTIAIFTCPAVAQLISPNGNPPLNRISTQVASVVPPKLQGNASLEFISLDIVFDGGSHGAEFRRHDGGKLMLFFPHSGYWTPAARQQRTQPVAVLTHRNGNQILVEIKPDSALNQRIVNLIDADISAGNHADEKIRTLTRIRDSIRKRTPLKEIAERMDPKTGNLRLEDDPFGEGAEP